MNFISIISIFLTIISLTKAETEEEMAVACQNEVRLSPEMMRRAENFDFPDDPTYKEFLSCLFKSQGIQDYTGKVSLTHIMNYLSDSVPKEQLEEVNNYCVTITGNNDGEKAYNAMSCIFLTLEKLNNKTQR